MNESSSGFSTGADRVASVRAVTVAIPLPQHLQLGAMRITQRLYTVVSLTTESGLTGNAYGLSRDLPVAWMVEHQLAPIIIGSPADLISDLWDRAYQSAIAGGRTGAYMRALSLVDIALWDIKGKRAQLPVWRLLGGADPNTKCVLVGGYPTAGDGPEEIGERVADLANKGHTLIKVARIGDVQELKLLLSTAAKGLPQDCRLIVDAAWCWNSAGDAEAEIRRWVADAPLAWIEDPLVPEDTLGYSLLCGSHVAAIGVGDELTDRHAAYRLLSGARVSVLRIDATTIGGISGAWHLSHVARAANIPVSFHIYPETHVHLAAGGASGGLTETFGPADNPWDPALRLYTGGPDYRPDVAAATEEPGLGIELDVEFIEAHQLSDGS